MDYEELYPLRRFSFTMSFRATSGRIIVSEHFTSAGRFGLSLDIIFNPRLTSHRVLMRLCLQVKQDTTGVTAVPSDTAWPSLSICQSPSMVEYSLACQLYSQVITCCPLHSGQLGSHCYLTSLNPPVSLCPIPEVHQELFLKNKQTTFHFTC